MSIFKKLLENLGWFNPEPEIAVLVDAENISPKVAEYAIDQARQMGSVRIIRAYANWIDNNPQGYVDLVSRGLHRVQVDKLRGRKNSTDIALSAEAAYLAGRGKVNTFVLVSGDQDFVPLVQTLKLAGCTVIGVADRQAALDLRPACHRFLIAEIAPARRSLAAPVVAVG